LTLRARLTVNLIKLKPQDNLITDNANTSGFFVVNGQESHKTELF
jgi:hypothetical protein